MIVHCGESIIFGNPPAVVEELRTATIFNLPVGWRRLRFKFRNNDFLRCFVLMPEGVREYVVARLEYGFKLVYEQRATVRRTAKSLDKPRRRAIIPA